MTPKKIIAFAGVLVVTGGIASIADACSVCLTGAEDATAEAINASVLFLMATPYLVVGSIAAGLVLARRRMAARRDLDETDEPAIPTTRNHKESGR